MQFPGRRLFGVVRVYPKGCLTTRPWGGIARWAQMRVQEWVAAGRDALLSAMMPLTAERVGHAADRGDSLAQSIWTDVGYRLGQAVAVLIDLFNPEQVILGGFTQSSRRGRSIPCARSWSAKFCLKLMPRVRCVRRA